MWAQVAKNCKNLEFLIKKFAPKDEIPLSNFYKIRCDGGYPRYVPSRLLPNLKMQAYWCQICIIANFCFKFSLKGYVP